jgi:hypothetical protein
MRQRVGPGRRTFYHRMCLQMSSRPHLQSAAVFTGECATDEPNPSRESANFLQHIPEYPWLAQPDSYKDKPRTQPACPCLVAAGIPKRRGAWKTARQLAKAHAMSGATAKHAPMHPESTNGSRRPCRHCRHMRSLEPRSGIVSVPHYRSRSRARRSPRPG